MRENVDPQKNDPNMDPQPNPKKRLPLADLHFGVLLVLEPVYSPVHDVIILVRKGDLIGHATAPCRPPRRVQGVSRGGNRSRRARVRVG